MTIIHLQSYSKDGFFQSPGHFEHDGMILDGGKNGKQLDVIRNELEYSTEDVISVGFPKSGQTWVNAIIYEIKYKDNPEALQKELDDKWIFMELAMPLFNPGIQRIRRAKSPKLLKTHLPARYFERSVGTEGPKIVVIMRNPKDTLVSLYHFYRMNRALGQFSGKWDEFFELYKNKRLYYEDVLDHNVGWARQADQPNVHLVKYEDLHKDPHGEVKKLAAFFGVTVTDNEVESIVQTTTMENMALDKRMKPILPMFDEKISKFFRKGQVGDWQNYFSDDQSAYVDAEYHAKLKPVGLQFDFTSE